MVENRFLIRHLRVPPTRVYHRTGTATCGGRADPKRQSTPEALAYATLREILFDLVQAERALAIVQQSVPDDERGRHLAAIQVARAALETFL